MDLVTIIIPTYNRFETFLKRSINSACGQTYKNLEIIITDDCSTLDKKQQDSYIINLSITDKRIKYITSGTNTGFVDNLNRGLSNATGKYISILFDDDYFLSEYIESAVRVLNSDSEIAFVQQGAFNEIITNGTLKTTLYQPMHCGKITKYTYFHCLHPYYNNDNAIGWSVSPCNYVFRNKGIKFRTTLHPGFDARQLKRGSGYDVLYILDNFTDYNYCYHLPNHTCTFYSHENSFTVSKLDEVLVDTKKGILQYFNENFNYHKIELNQYLINEIYLSADNLIEKVNFFMKVIEVYNISIYEIKQIFFSNDIYNLPFEVLRNVINLNKISEDSSKYKNAYETLIQQRSRIPLLSEVKNIVNDKTLTYHQYLAKLLNIPITSEITILSKSLINLEIRIIASATYKNKFTPSSKNIILNFYDDLKNRKLKKIAMIASSSNIKYITFWKDELFKRATKVKTDSSWNNAFLQYLNRIYINDEVKLHSHKDANNFESELYMCDEFKKVNNITTKIPFNDFKNMKNALWKYIPIMFSYNDILAIHKKPLIEWDSHIKSINFDGPYYFNTKYNYLYNEIVGEDIACAIQISGHLRFYTELYDSFKYLGNIINCHYFMYMWNDSMGFKYINKKQAEIVNSSKNDASILLMKNNINNCLSKFNPIKHEIGNNDKYLKENLYFGGLPIVEYDGCSYPQIKSQYYTVYRANRLRMQHERDTNMKYDIVIKLRFDAILDHQIMDPCWVFNFYFMTNFKNVIFVSNNKDHFHTGGTTGCKLCDLEYYDFKLIQKHVGEHQNDICDFIAIASSDTMNHYADLYTNFEDLYTKHNNDIGQRIMLHNNRNKLKYMEKNVTVGNEYNSLYNHHKIKIDCLNEHGSYLKLPLYPEAFLKIHLKDYIVISNKYFRIMHKF